MTTHRYGDQAEPPAADGRRCVMSNMTSDPDRDDSEVKLREALEEEGRRAQQLRWDARAAHRALEGWRRVRSEEDWMRVCEESRAEYEAGQFWLERLGAERFLDPKLMATLLGRRQALIAEWGITTAAEMMLLDLALLSYFHGLRIQGWIGNLALHIEHEFFGQDVFAANGREGGRREERAVEERGRRLSEDLMPLLDRANRMLIRNLRAMSELRQGPPPASASGQAEQDGQPQ